MELPNSHSDFVDQELVLVTAYKHTFKKGAGKEVLEDLENRYLKSEYAGVTVGNQLAFAFDAGQRAVVQRILNILKTDENKYRRKMEELYVRDSLGPTEDGG